MRGSSPVAIGKAGQDRPAAVGGEAAGKAEEEIGAHKAGHSQDHGFRRPSRRHSRSTVSMDSRANRLRTVVIQEPWALVKPWTREQIGLIDRKGVDPQSHHCEQGKPAAQADHPGPETGASGRCVTGNSHRDPPFRALSVPQNNGGCKDIL